VGNVTGGFRRRLEWRGERRALAFGSRLNVKDALSRKRHGERRGGAVNGARGR